MVISYIWLLFGHFVTLILTGFYDFLFIPLIGVCMQICNSSTFIPISMYAIYSFCVQTKSSSNSIMWGKLNRWLMVLKKQKQNEKKNMRTTKKGLICFLGFSSGLNVHYFILFQCNCIGIGIYLYTCENCLFDTIKIKWQFDIRFCSI